MTKIPLLALALMAALATGAKASHAQAAQGANGQSAAASQSNSQAQTGTQGNAQNNAQSPGQKVPSGTQAPAAAAAPPGPHPKTPAEARDLQSLVAVAESATTTPAAMQKAVNEFLERYPATEMKESAMSLGLLYSEQHNDYEGVLQYGEQVLKEDPNSALALAALATQIPMHVRKTDLDGEMRLNEAAADDARLAKLIADPATRVNGNPLTPQNEAYLQSRIYESKSMIAMDRSDYNEAIRQFNQLLPMLGPASQGVVYYRMAMAQEGLKQYDAAKASLTKATQLDSSNQNLVAMVKIEREKIERAQAAAAGTPH
jgi:tetratricopeptide (TPR) repeat protein